MSKFGDHTHRGQRRAAAGVGLLSPREKVHLAALSVDKARRDAMARLRRSRLLRWRYRTGVADDVLISPTPLRMADPSFLDELSVGSFGLAGYVCDVGDGSPFEAEPPSEAWLRELHGFAWLRHLDATINDTSREIARGHVQDWLHLPRALQAPGWVPEVTARRIISWLTHENLLLDWAEPRDHDAIMLSLEHQVMFLRTSWLNALDGYPRLLCLIAVVQADLCVSGRGDDRLAQSQAALADELDRQILADGGHVSRNPWVGVELLLDLLPLKPCFPARERTLEPRIATAMERMMGMLHHLRMGDGSLARFNGMGAPEQATLGAVMAYAAPGHEAQSIGPKGPSGYLRLERGRTTLLLDAGKPGAFEVSGAAHAGCLSFELSSGRHLVLVNNGAPGPRHPALLPAARATASHNTLCLNEQSSARLIRNERLEALLGSPPLSHPTRVSCEVSEEERTIALVASHDGYLDRTGLVHTRFLALSADGCQLAGKDRLGALNADMRLSWDIPFAIHFHLHPAVTAVLSQAGDAVELALPDGETWRFTAGGKLISLERSIFVADPSGPAVSEQMVLRWVCGGVAEVDWKLEKLPRAEAPEAA
ncbi:MAG: heparinase II/III family protein [Hyphomicrobiaceae bacterium]|nr:heparinase II/III family protein [Hyphomicrobiaceae bacterium]